MRSCTPQTVDLGSRAPTMRSQFQFKFFSLLWLLSLVCLFASLVLFLFAHCTAHHQLHYVSIYCRLGVFNVLKLSHNLEEEDLDKQNNSKMNFRMERQQDCITRGNSWKLVSKRCHYHGRIQLCF